jgi:carbon monoxide dehydrogenase subunit G
MGKVTKSIEINASPEEVFNFINNMEKMNKAHEGLTKGEYTSNEAVGVGTNARFVLKAGEFDAKIIEFVKNRKVSWRTIEGSKAKIINSFILEPTTKGTKLTNSMEYELPYSILGKLIGKLKIGKEIDKEFTLWMENAKKVLET